MVGEAVYGRGRAGRKTAVRTIDDRKKDVVPSPSKNKLLFQTPSVKEVYTDSKVVRVSYFMHVTEYFQTLN